MSPFVFSFCYGNDFISTFERDEAISAREGLGRRKEGKEERK